jgi:hypothetical protein
VTADPAPPDRAPLGRTGVLSLDDAGFARLLRHEDGAGPGETWRVRVTERATHAYRFTVETPQRRWNLYFSSEDVELHPTAEAAVTALYVSAAARGAGIEIDEPLDELYLQNVQEAALVLYGWEDGFSTPVLTTAGTTRHVLARAEGAGSVIPFSGGVDSTYSALVAADEVRWLLGISGFELRPGHAHLPGVEARARTSAAQLGLPFGTVQTNAKKFTKRYAARDRHTHGSLLAAVAHLRPDGASRMLVPASGASAAPWGSHFTLDRCWASSTVEVVHHCRELSRTEKIRHLAARPDLAAQVKYCSNRVTVDENCGSCAKCVRTGLTFKLLGVRQLLGFSTDDITPEAVAGLPPDSRRTLVHLRRLAAAVGEQDYVDALGSVLAAD